MEEPEESSPENSQETQYPVAKNTEASLVTESFLLVGNSGILDIDFFSWTIKFQPVVFEIVSSDYAAKNLQLTYPLIVTIEYYEGYKDPYSEVWIGDIENEEGI